jgi:predicted Rossmann fold nucleotide-binding protein DprA/Smf involved in DNA uptake
MDDRVRDFREVIRDEMIMRDRVLAVLQEGPRTVPEIAESMGSPAHEVMYWVMAARKYGLVAEVKDPDDDYFQYELVEKK